MIREDHLMSRPGQRFYIDLPGAEAIESFPCFGGQCTVLVIGRSGTVSAREAALRSKRRLLDWHHQFSRFEPDSELSRLNADPRATVPVGPEMAELVHSALMAAALTDGLVDPTLMAEIEQAGYRGHFDAVAVPLGRALALAPDRSPAAPSVAGRWREITVDRDAGTVTRRPGERVDSGGIAKGWFGDLLADELAGHESFAVDAAGDIRFGGTARLLRPIRVVSPFDDSVLHVFERTRGAAATSGIGKRSWLEPNGKPAHHLLDPCTGAPAFTGIVQVTALAPSGVEAETLSKAALLSGPDGARTWLSHGGVVIYDDKTFDVFEPSDA
jgi:thiamine biosynthesis lipoprotein